MKPTLFLATRLGSRVSDYQTETSRLNLLEAVDCAWWLKPILWSRIVSNAITYFLSVCFVRASDFEISTLTIFKCLLGFPRLVTAPSTTEMVLKWERTDLLPNELDSEPVNASALKFKGSFTLVLDPQLLRISWNTQRFLCNNFLVKRVVQDFKRQLAFRKFKKLNPIKLVQKFSNSYILRF